MKDGKLCSSSGDKTIRIWDVTKCQCIKKIEDIVCFDSNGLSKLNDNTLLVGGIDLFYTVNIETCEARVIKDKLFGSISCFNVLRYNLIFFTTSNGGLCCYDLMPNQIVSLRRIHKSRPSCVIRTEDNKLISCSYDDTSINIYV